jgi:putative flippase GtrA
MNEQPIREGRSGLAERIHLLYRAAPPFVRTPGFWQLVRFAFAGLGVTLFSACVYMIAAYPFHVQPLVANVISYAFGFTASYAVHSRWSFASDDADRSEVETLLRFLMASVFAFALNSFWVWLATSYHELPPWAPVPAMVFITPLASFLINRYWVFRVA